MILPFLKDPLSFEKDSKKIDWPILIRDFMLMAIGLIALMIGISLLIQMILLLTGQADFKELATAREQVNHGFFSSKNSYFGIAKVIFIAPILEELMYRLPVSFKKRDITIGICVIVFFYVGDPILKMNILSSGTYLKFTVIGITLLLCYLLLKQQYLDQIIKRRIIYNIIFYGLALHFAWSHSPKLLQELAPSLIWLKPLYVLPQFSLAIAGSYFRLRYGIIWAIIFHMAFNTPATLVYLLNQFNI